MHELFCNSQLTDAWIAINIDERRRHASLELICQKIGENRDDGTIAARLEMKEGAEDSRQDQA